MDTITAHDHEIISKTKLLAWINTHDCGVLPCGVLRDDGAIEIRCIAVARDGTVTTETEVVRTLNEARDALGY